MKNKYPTKYEIYQALTEMTSASFVKSFAQKRGLFVMNAKQTEIANEITKLFLEESDIEEIRLEAYQQSITHSLSGFIISSTEKHFSAKDIYNRIFENSLFKEGITLNALQKVGETEVFKGTYKYNKNKPGRIQLLQGEENEFDFFISEVSDNIWKVEIDSTKSTDLKEIKELFESNTNREVHFSVIDSRLLTTEKSVQFFDGLNSFGDKENWKLKQIKHIAIKKASSEDGEDIPVNDGDLEGINHALIEGHNLRENNFITSAVAQGFQFNAMTYEFENLKKPKLLEIKAEFKGRPKVFEVTIVKFSEIVGSPGILKESTLNPKDSIMYRSSFWNFARNIFDKVKNSKSSEK